VNDRVSDAELAWMIDGWGEADMPGLGEILGKSLASVEPSRDAPSPERCDRFLKQAATLGLIRPNVQSLSLREYMAAPLLLPAYLDVAATALIDAGRKVADLLQTWGAQRALPTLYATLLPDPSAQLAPAALRGSRMTPALAYQAGSISIFLSTSRGIVEGRRQLSLEALISAEGTDPASLSGSLVRLTAAAGPQHTTRVSESGTFSIDGLAAGIYSVKIEFADVAVVIKELRLPA